MDLKYYLYIFNQSVIWCHRGLDFSLPLGLYSYFNVNNVDDEEKCNIYYIYVKKVNVLVKNTLHVSTMKKH